MKISPDQLPVHLRRDALAPIYLVSGDEPLLLGEAADAVRTRAREAGFDQREVHFAERGVDWSVVAASSASLSLFGDRRLIEVRLEGARPGKDGGKAIADLCGSIADDTRLLIVCNRLDRDAQNSAWVKAAESRGVWVAVWPIETAKLPAWLTQRLRAVGLEATNEAVEILAERVEGNLLAARQEIDKLRLRVAGTVLDAEAVLAAVTDSARFEINGLGEAAISGDAGRALRMLAGLRAEGAEPTLVLWALVREMHTLWRMRQSGVAAEGPGPRRGAAYVRALAVAQRRVGTLSFPVLAARALRTDRVIKGRGHGDAWDEMALFCAELCGHRAVPWVATTRGL